METFDRPGEPAADADQPTTMRPVVKGAAAALSAAASRQEAAGAIADMSKTDLLTLAAEMEVGARRHESTVAIQRQIVNHVGSRLDHEAIISGEWNRSRQAEADDAEAEA
jgi:hypothetical protein